MRMIISEYLKINSAGLWNLIISIVFLSIILFQSCDDTITQIEEIPEEDVSYAKHLQPLFNVVCATSGCHDDNSKAGGYSMTSWSNVVQPGIVSPNFPEESLLYWRISPDSGLPIMPPISTGYLTQNQIDGIKTWIEEGAKNN